MSLIRIIHRPSTLLLMLGTLVIVSGCASRPRYGAAPRHKRGCDCPKWNAAPGHESKDVRAQLINQAPEHSSVHHATHH